MDMSARHRFTGIEVRDRLARVASPPLVIPAAPGVLQRGQVEVERTRHGPFERLSFAFATATGRSQHSVYRLGDTLIDTGGTVATKELLALLRDRSPRRIVCTHQHEDHVGNIAAIRRAFGDLPVFVPRHHVPIVTITAQIPEYRALFWGHPEPSGPVDPYDPGAVFEDSSVALEAVLTPGHTPHHVTFVAGLSAERTLAVYHRAQVELRETV